MMPEDRPAYRFGPQAGPLLVREVRSPGAGGWADLAGTVLGKRRSDCGECVIDGGAGALGQGLVGEPVDVPLGLAGAGLPEQRGDLLERDASGAELRRERVP
jgi:hypothetical protein